MDFIYDLMDRASEYSDNTIDGTWSWFNGLHREEWMLLLAITASAGFVMMMLGFGNRK